MIHVVAAIALATTFCARNAVAGKYPQDHHGFFIGFNVGAGTADVSTSGGGDSDREWGGAGNFRLGGAVKNNLLISGEFTGWAKEIDGATASLNTALFAVTYYPTSEGLFLRGGVGFGGSHVEADAGNGYRLSKDENGFAMAAAAGYEWRLTRKFALGPQVEFNWLDIGGDIVDTANYFNATLGFNWYW